MKIQPNPLAPFEEKISEEYGLKIAELISGEWFNGGFITDHCNYGRRRDYIRQKRLFIRGESGNDYFKKQMTKSDNDLSYLNLDWEQLNWGEKFARIVSNSVGDENYKIKVTSIDRISEMRKRNKVEFYRKHILGQGLSQKFNEVLGVDTSPGVEIPETEEDIDLFMEMKDRPKIEIAEELLIDYVKKTNNWDTIEVQKNKDITDIGLIVGRVWIDKNDGVKVQYIDPEYYIHSEVKNFDFSDKVYDGYIERITLADVKRESGFDDKRLAEIAKKAGTHVTNFYDQDWDDILNQYVYVCRFAYKTYKTMKYKTKLRDGKVVKVIEKNSDFNSDGKHNFGVLEKTLDTWLEGTFIVGTKDLYGYQECENLYDDIMNTSVSPYVAFAYDMYKNRLRSFTDNIEAPARQLQKIHLKIQQLISEMKPDIIEIDLDMLAELDDGKGGSKKESWQTALDLLNAKGVVFKKRINLGEDGLKDDSAVKTYAVSQGSGLAPLLNAWAHYYNLIRENTGINPARDGSMPGYALIGTSELAQMASNTVTQGVVKCALLFNKRIAEVISSRIHTIFSYKQGRAIQELYSNVISKELLNSVEIMKDRNLHEFGFVIDLRPTEEEMKEFNESLSLSINDGTIDVEVATEARSLAKSNMKLATRYLIYERRKRIRQRQEEEMMLSENKSKNDAMAAQARIQAEMQSYEHKKQTDVWFEQQKAQIEIVKRKAIAEIENENRGAEFNEKVYLKHLENVALSDKEKYREDRKDKRTEKQASQQSQLIEQRKGNMPAMNFETVDDVNQGSEILLGN